MKPGKETEMLLIQYAKFLKCFRACANMVNIFIEVKKRVTAMIQEQDPLIQVSFMPAKQGIFGSGSIFGIFSYLGNCALGHCTQGLVPLVY